MTDTDHQPYTTTDNLTEHVARWVAALGMFDWDQFPQYHDEWRERARALLTSGPLADRLAALTRVEALADQLTDPPGLKTPAGFAANLIRAALRGDR